VRPRLGRRAWTRPSCSLPVATPMPMTNEAPRRALSAVGDHSADLGPGRDRRVRRSPRVGELRDLRGGHRPIGGERLGGIPRARTCRQRWLPSHYITCAYGRLSRRKWRWPVRDRHAVAAAGLFAICSALGAAVALREDIPGEPLGIRVPGSVAAHLATGWGSALSAPAPMQVAVLAAAFLARPGLAWPRRTLTGIGVAGFAGMLVEPVTWGRRSRSRAVAAMVPLNLASAAALIWAGRTMVK
jgi:hypothetical protein